MARSFLKTGRIALMLQKSLACVLSVALVCSLCVLISPVKAADTTFSIMQITDTQYLTHTDLHPHLFNDLTTWVAQNYAAYNTQMVIHTGDIVNEPDNTTPGNGWNAAETAMNTLTSNNIPYVWCAGNHDQIGYDNPDSGWIGNQYSAFNPATFSSNNYWVGDNNEGKNTAVKFSFGGYNFLIVDLEFDANAATMAWATNLLNVYSNYNVIFCMHSYIATPKADFPVPSTWEDNVQTLLNQHSNVFMTLNGHSSSDDAMISAHNTVGGRTQIQFDFQDADKYNGAAAVRIYSFNLTSNTVSVTTYSVYHSEWITDSTNDFVFSANLTPATSTNSTPTFTPTPGNNYTPSPSPTPKPIFEFNITNVITVIMFVTIACVVITKRSGKVIKESKNKN
jgi:hypothetical protein